MLIVNSSMRWECPFLESFIQIIEKNKDWSYSLIGWQRNGNPSSMLDEREILCPVPATIGNSKFKKIIDHLKFVRFVIEKIEERKPDILFIASIQLAVFLAPYLKKSRIPYLIDIRDPSIVWQYARYVFSFVVRNAEYVFISSPGFKKWLPTGGKYILSHNVTWTQLSLRKNYSCRNIEKECKILTIGHIRFYEANLKFVQSMEGMPVQMIFSGALTPEGEKLFQETHLFRNVKFTGAYDKKDELDIISQSDFVLLLVSGENKEDNMGNRFYNSLIACRPLIANEGTVTADYIEKFSLGTVVRNDFSDAWENIKHYANSFDPEVYLKNRNRLLDEIEQDVLQFESIFSACLK